MVITHQQWFWQLGYYYSTADTKIEVDEKFLTKPKNE